MSPTPLPQPPVRTTPPTCSLARRNTALLQQSTITLSHPCSLPHSTIIHTLSPLACVFTPSPVMITTLILPADPSRRPFERGRESPDLGLLAAAPAIQRQGTLHRHRIQGRVLRDQESAPVSHQPPGSLQTLRSIACRWASLLQTTRRTTQAPGRLSLRVQTVPAPMGLHSNPALSGGQISPGTPAHHLLCPPPPPATTGGRTAAVHHPDRQEVNRAGGGGQCWARPVTAAAHWPQDNPPT